MNENDLVGSVEKAMKMLMLFEDAQISELSIQQMSKALGIPKSSAHRLATTLVKSQFLIHNEETRNYGLGIKNYILGNKYLTVMTLEKVSKPYLEAMVRKFGESVSLSRPDGLETVIVDKLDGLHSMRVISQIGKRNPLHCTASGKIFLAFATDEERRAILQKIQPLQPMTERTIIQADELVANLEQVCGRGFAYDDEEIFVGQTCVSAPIFDNSGRVCAAMTISGPKQRIHGKGIAAIGSDLIAATAEISLQLGCTKEKGH